MEWSTKPPMQWDWDDFLMFNTATEDSKKSQVIEWEIDGGRGIDSGSLYSSGSGTGGGSGSDLGLASLSKSSKSTSINSSSVGEVKTSNITMEASEATLDGSTTNKAITVEGTSNTLEVPFGSGEPLLGLKLGKRTYFEDVSAGSYSKTSSLSVNPGPSISPPKRSKSSSQALLATRCQVEGCNLDLSLAKDYHRKHRVCESHSKCPKVIVAGVERRFCQQCSRFHGLSEFDEKKRSCRRRLSDHNARRRKPQPEPLPLNPARLSSSLYGGRQQMNLVWNRTSFVYDKLNSNLAWEGISSSKSATTAKDYASRPAKVTDIDGHLHFPVNKLTASSVSMHPHDSESLLPSKAKVPATDILNQGSEDQEPIISLNGDATQDFHRALSLLSTNSWGSCDPKPISHEPPPRTSHTDISQSMQHTAPGDGLAFASSDYWRTGQPLTKNARVHHTPTSQNDSSSYFQEFQLLRTPYDTDFYSGQLS